MADKEEGLSAQELATLRTRTGGYAKARYMVHDGFAEIVDADRNLYRAGYVPERFTIAEGVFSQSSLSAWPGTVPLTASPVRGIGIGYLRHRINEEAATGLLFVDGRKPGERILHVEVEAKVRYADIRAVAKRLAALAYGRSLDPAERERAMNNWRAFSLADIPTSAPPLLLCEGLDT